MPVTIVVEGQNGRNSSLVVNRLISVDGVAYQPNKSSVPLEERVERLEAILNDIVSQFPPENQEPEGELPP